MATYTAKDFVAGDTLLAEQAVLVSAVWASKANWDLWQALLRELNGRRLPATVEPSGHLGALVALRDLGPEGCQKLLQSKCVGPEESLPGPAEAKRDAAVLRCAVGQGLVPQSASRFPPADYARLRKVFQLNGFRLNGDLREGDPGYDVGEALFDTVSRINHSCSPNARFDLVVQQACVSAEPDGAADGPGSPPRDFPLSPMHILNCIVASRDIRAGEEVCISYIPVRCGLPVAERRRDLRAHWDFDCDCQLCMEEGGPPVVPVARAVQAYEPPGTRSSEKDEAHAASSNSSEGVCWEDLGDPEDAF